MGKKIDLTGKRFGKWLVLAESGKYTAQRHILWLCRCDCGAEHLVAGGSLRRKTRGTMMCKECFLKSRRLPKGEASFNQLYRRYHRAAANRGHRFKLTKAEFKALTSSDCHYCGSKPQTMARWVRVNGPYIYNGIDRVDNSRGYEPDNCVPCCGTCNIMKGTLSRDEFKLQIKAIWKHFVY